MISSHARETVPSSSLKGETGHGPQARKGMSVVLIDQQTLIRHCLTRSFQEGLPDLRVVAVANLADLLDASRSLRSIDLIVLNIGGASLRDVEVLGQITWLRQHMPRVPLVLLMDRDDMDDIVEAMAQGVRGFITTSMELLETGAAIQCVAAGGTFVPASIQVRSAQDRQNGSKCGPSEDSKELFESLTPRELEVFALLREGKPNKVVARALGIREGTVKVFVGRILGKLHASNRTELALLARAWSAALRNRLDPTNADNDRAWRARLHPDQPPSEAAAALQCVAAGGVFVPASALIKVAQARPNGAGPSMEHETSASQRLTPREGEVLARLRQGKPNKIIAFELDIAESTVKVFVRQILMKLDASNRTEVAILPPWSDRCRGSEATAHAKADRRLPLARRGDQGWSSKGIAEEGL